MSTPVGYTLPLREATGFVKLDMDGYRARLNERKIKRRQAEEAAEREARRNSQMTQLRHFLKVLDIVLSETNGNIKNLKEVLVVSDLDDLQKELDVLMKNTFSKCEKLDGDFVFLEHRIEFGRVVDDLLELLNQIADIADTVQNHKIKEAIVLSASNIHEMLTQVATILAQ